MAGLQAVGEAERAAVGEKRQGIHHGLAPGLVVEQSQKSLLTPCIKVFYSTRSNARIKPEIIDLSRPDCPDKITGREDPSKWNFPDLNELWSGLPENPW